MGKNTQGENFIGPKMEHEDESVLGLLVKDPATFVLGSFVLIAEMSWTYLILVPYYWLSIKALKGLAFILGVDESSISAEDKKIEGETPLFTQESDEDFDYTTLPPAEDGNSATTDPLGDINLEEVD
jgi:hypothetical protein